MSSPRAPIGFALCGASGIAVAHGRALARLPDARLLSVYSSDPERARRLGEAFQCAWTCRYDEILEDRRILAIDIVTDPERHAALALQALASGKHVLIEKPLDVDLEAGARVVAAAASTGKRVGVMSPRRFDARLRVLRRRLHAGDIGPVHLALATMLMYRDRTYYEQPTAWRQRVGHVLLNQGIHWLDTLIWLFGFPEEVHAAASANREFAGPFDTALVCSRHAGGVLAALAASTACRRAENEERLVVHGASGTLDYVPERQRRGLKRVIGALHVQLQPDTACTRDPFRAQIADFVTSIRTGSTPAVSAEDGYNAMRFVKLCEAAVARVERPLLSES